MLQSQGMTAQQQQTLFAMPQQPNSQQQQQQFNPSPSQQNLQVPLPPNHGGNGSNFDISPQQLEQFLRQNPALTGKDGERHQAIAQLMMRAKQSGANLNLTGGSGSNGGGNTTPQQQQRQLQQPQQQQQPHAVGLNGYAGQQQQPAQQQQQQRQPTPQMQQQQLQPQQQMSQQQQQRMTNEQINLAAQQFQNANMGNDAQRQIEAVRLQLRWLCFESADTNQLQAMKQRQRSGLVTPQMGNGNSLPLTSPQPVGQQMQQPPQSVGSQPNLTPAHHHRTLSQSSNIQPPMPQPPMQPQQQQQGDPTNSSTPAGVAAAIQNLTDDQLVKAAASVVKSVLHPNVSRHARSPLPHQTGSEDPILTPFARRL